MNSVLFHLIPSVCADTVLLSVPSLQKTMKEKIERKKVKLKGMVSASCVSESLKWRGPFMSTYKRLDTLSGKLLGQAPEAKHWLTTNSP